MINATSSYFDRCRGVVDLDRLFENCVYDACATDDVGAIYHVSSHKPVTICHFSLIKCY